MKIQVGNGNYRVFHMDKEDCGLVFGIKHFFLHFYVEDTCEHFDVWNIFTFSKGPSYDLANFSYFDLAENVKK